MTGVEALLIAHAVGEKNFSNYLTLLSGKGQLTLFQLRVTETGEANFISEDGESEFGLRDQIPEPYFGLRVLHPKTIVGVREIHDFYLAFGVHLCEINLTRGDMVLSRQITWSYEKREKDTEVKLYATMGSLAMGPDGNRKRVTLSVSEEQDFRPVGDVRSFDFYF